MATHGARAIVVAVGLSACVHGDGMVRRGDRARPTPVVAAPIVTAPPATPAPPPLSPALRRVEFARDVRPILEARCRPCHFPGGVMYGRLPFDREETIHTLGEKLFTRIKAPEEQQVIREMLAAANP